MGAMTLLSEAQQASLAQSTQSAVVFERPSSTFQTTRRGFKEKLLETLSNAQEVCQSQGVDAPTKQSILIECLVGGDVQTFVDLFYMTAPEVRPTDEELVAKGVGAQPGSIYARPH